MISCVIKLYLGDIHRPRMSAAHDGLSKAQGCLWYSLAGHETTSYKSEEIPGWTRNSHFFKNRPACSSWIALVRPIHVHLFHVLVIFVSDQVHNQDKYLNVF